MEGIGRGIEVMYKLMLWMILPAVVGVLGIIWLIFRGVMWTVQHVRVM